MRFKTTLRIEAAALSVIEADEITEAIRELGYPGDGWKRDTEDLVWEVEFEGSSLDEIARRYRETEDKVATETSGWTRWEPGPDDPLEVAVRAARETLAWIEHVEGIELPDDLRAALARVAGEEDED